MDKAKLNLLLGGEPGSLTSAIITGDIPTLERHLEDFEQTHARSIRDASAHIGMGGVPYVVLALYVREYEALAMLIDCRALDAGLEDSERKWLKARCDRKDYKGLKIGINELYNNAFERLETLIALGTATGAQQNRAQQLDALQQKLKNKARKRSQQAQRARDEKVRQSEETAAIAVHRRRTIGKMASPRDVEGSRWDLHERDRELFVAVMQRDFIAVKEAIAAGANVGAQDNEKNEPLFFAVSYGFPEIADFLLQRGANVHHVNLYKWTMLHAAAVHCRIDMIHLIIRHGGWDLLQVKNTLGQRPIDAARTYYIKEYLCGYMMDRKSGKKSLSAHTLPQGQRDTTKHATFNRKRFSSNRDHSRYLGFVVNQYVDAVRHDDFEFLRDEEAAGADLDMPCNFGMTPLMHAIVFDRERIVAHLVETADAELSTRTALGNTVMHFAYQLTDTKSRKRMVAYLKVSQRALFGSVLSRH